MEVFEHPFAMLDFAPAQAPVVPAVQAGGMALEPEILEKTGLLADREANDHAEDSTRAV